MATVYKITIKTVSAWVNYSESDIAKMFEKFMYDTFENTEIEVERDAILVELNKSHVKNSVD